MYAPSKTKRSETSDDDDSLGQAQLPVWEIIFSIVLHTSAYSAGHLMADSTPTIALLRSSTLISQGAEAVSCLNFYPKT